MSSITFEDLTTNQRTFMFNAEHEPFTIISFHEREQAKKLTRLGLGTITKSDSPGDYDVFTITSAGLDLLKNRQQPGNVKNITLDEYERLKACEQAMEAIRAAILEPNIVPFDEQVRRAVQTTNDIVAGVKMRMEQIEILQQGFVTFLRLKAEGKS